ncbi:uncharacterized protein M421DRAFT_252863 [Didymella exigua CBS 183.55]|uniref:Uncharacterized protein n=1 Tax=Didymella exigua CBS 183.55 TaxID=1150837 RepID=A0A6A5RWP6_9PLEO|nr:uncharacterized protein M421DRAFT_252863 [Didymella exigua CBS 183.55]KAF1932925.1 hypothetical protein M421DRAFT_252863 [Didymella exigua CBS 183.55]
MMPHNVFGAHFNQQQQLQSSRLTWLNLYSSSNETSSRMLDALLLARIDKVKETLEFINWTIEVRRQLVALAENNGAFCTICSHLRVATCFTFCSAICPLLRGRPETWMKRDPPWTNFARKDVELYDKLIIDINHFGYEANKRIVIKWEVTCTDLLGRTEDPKNRYSVQLAMPPVRGLNQDWTFNGHWGQGPRLEVELAPDEAELPATDEIGTSAPDDA